MQRHIGLEILESTFVLAAEEAGYAVDMQEGSALAPSINVGIRAANTIERECEARSRALGTYASRALARYSDWDVPFDQQRSSSTYWQVRR